MIANDSAEYRRKLERDNERLLSAARLAVDLIDRCQHALKIAAVCKHCANSASNYLRGALGDRR